MFYHELLRKSVTSIGPTTLGTVKKVCVKDVFQSIICDPCDPCNAICFNLFATTSIHSMRNITGIRNWETARKVTQKIQLFKAQKTENSVEKSEEK